MVNDNNITNRLSNYQAIRNRRRRRETIFGNQIASRRLSNSPVIEVYSDSEEEERRITRNITSITETITRLRRILHELYDSRNSIRRRRSVRMAVLEERRRQIEDYGLPSYRQATQNDLLPSYDEIRRNQDNIVNNTVLNGVVNNNNNNNNNNEDGSSSDDTLDYLPSADELLNRIIREQRNNSNNNNNTNIRSKYFNK